MWLPMDPPQVSQSPLFCYFFLYLLSLFIFLLCFLHLCIFFLPYLQVSVSFASFSPPSSSLTNLPFQPYLLWQLLYFLFLRATCLRGALCQLFEFEARAFCLVFNLSSRCVTQGWPLFLGVSGLPWKVLPATAEDLCPARSLRSHFIKWPKGLYTFQIFVILETEEDRRAILPWGLSVVEINPVGFPGSHASFISNRNVANKLSTIYSGWIVVIPDHNRAS